MAFFRDLKVVLGSLIKAAGHGMSLLADMAAEAEKLAKEANEALVVYSKKRNIERLEEEINSSSFSTVAHGVEKKQALLAGYDELIRQVGAKESGVSEKRVQLADQIRSLEAKRHSSRKDTYASGSIKSSIQLYDGKRHGVCEYWYESGALKTRGEFKCGVLHDKLEHWYESGDQRIRGNRSRGGGLSVEVFMKGARRIARFDRVGHEIEMQLWLWNGVSVGRVRRCGGVYKGVTLLKLRVLFSIPILRSIYRGREGGSEHPSFLEFMDVINSSAIAMENDFAGICG